MASPLARLDCGHAFECNGLLQTVRNSYPDDMCSHSTCPHCLLISMHIDGVPISHLTDRWAMRNSLKHAVISHTPVSDAHLSLVVSTAEWIGEHNMSPELYAAYVRFVSFQQAVRSAAKTLRPCSKKRAGPWRWIIAFIRAPWTASSTETRST